MNEHEGLSTIKLEFIGERELLKRSKGSVRRRIFFAKTLVGEVEKDEG